MRFGNFVVVRYNGRVVCGKLGDGGIYLEYIGDANPIPACEVEPLFEIETSRPFPEYFNVDDFRKFVISTLTDADPTKKFYSAITFCDNCGCSWLDDGLNPIGCPYCKWTEQSAEIEKLRAERDALREALKDMRQVLEVLGHAHRVAMEQTLKARLPECGEFAEIAQDLDFVVAVLRERLGEGAEP